MRRLVAALLPILVILLAPAGAQATATLGLPAASSVHNGNIAFSYGVSQTPSALFIDFIYVSGPGAYTGNTWSIPISGTQTNLSWQINPANPGGDTFGYVGTPVTSNGANGTALPDGTYNVQVRYNPASAPSTEITSALTTNVVLDRATQSPTLASPSTFAGFSIGTGMYINYTLPEAATPGTVTLTFSGSSSMNVLTFANSDATVGNHTFTIDPSDPTASPHVVSAVGDFTTAIRNGVHTATLSYQDALGNPASTVTNYAIEIDTVTRPPILGQPSAGSPYPGAVPVSFSLPEQMTAGTAILTFTGSVTRRVVLNSVGAGTTTLSLNRSDLAGSSGVTSAPDGNTLPDGTYDVSLSYQDYRINPSASVTTTGVEFGPLPVTTQTVTTTVEQTQTVTTSTPGETVTVQVPTTPTTLAPLALKPRFTAKRSGNRWRIAATFKALAGAKRYELRAVRGANTVRASCRERAGTVACSATVRKPGGWKLTVSALAGTKVLAKADKRLTLR